MRNFNKLTIGEIGNLNDEDIKGMGLAMGKEFLEAHPEMVAGLGEKLIREKIAAVKAINDALREG